MTQITLWNMDKEFVQNSCTMKNEMEALIMFALTNLVPSKHFCTVMKLPEILNDVLTLCVHRLLSVIVQMGSTIWLTIASSYHKCWRERLKNTCRGNCGFHGKWCVAMVMLFSEIAHLEKLSIEKDNYYLHFRFICCQTYAVKMI